MNGEPDLIQTSYFCQFLFANYILWMYQVSFQSHTTKIKSVTISLLSTFSYVNGLKCTSTHITHTLTKSTNLSTNVCQFPEPPCLKWINVEYTSPEDALGRRFFSFFDTDQNIWIKPKWHSRLSPCIDKSWFKWIKSLVIQCKK